MSDRFAFELEMTGNGFLHSNSLPFPSSQFPFPFPNNGCGINNFGLSKTVHWLSLSLKLIMTARIMLYCIT